MVMPQEYQISAAGCVIDITCLTKEILVFDFGEESFSVHQAENPMARAGNRRRIGAALARLLQRRMRFTLHSRICPNTAPADRLQLLDLAPDITRLTVNRDRLHTQPASARHVRGWSTRDHRFASTIRLVYRSPEDHPVLPFLPMLRQCGQRHLGENTILNLAFCARGMRS